MLITLGMQTESIFQAPEIPMQMIALGLVILAAHLGGKLCARLRLSEVTGQLLGGALVDPYSLHLLHLLPEGNLAYDNAINAFHFFVFVFLGLVAFGIGEELHITRVKKVGKAAFVICLIQRLLTWATISLSFYFIAGKPLLESLLIGSIGIATAPAVTFVLMNQLNVEGRLRHLLGNMVVLDDLIEVIIFSLLIQFSISQTHPETTGGASAVLTVGGEVLFALAEGGCIYLFLRTFVRKRAFSLAQDEGDHAHRRDEAFLQRILAEHPSPSVEILLIVLAAVSLGTGLAYHFHWPFLITAMFAGFLVANFHSQAIFDSLKLDNIAPALNLVFFALIGANISMADPQHTRAGRPLYRKPLVRQAGRNMDRLPPDARRKIDHHLHADPDAAAGRRGSRRSGLRHRHTRASRNRRHYSPRHRFHRGRGRVHGGSRPAGLA